MRELGSIDEKNLELLRLFTITKSKALFERNFQSLLEIGPPRTHGAKNSPVYQKNRDWFFSIEDICIQKGVHYSSLDIDKSTEPNFLGSIDDPNLLPQSVGLKDYSRVVCFSILEHVKNPFLAIENMRNILSVGGEIHILTPWDLRFHGPRPDCWRISDDGFRHLLEFNFEIQEMEFLKQDSRPLSPVAIYVVAKRIQ